MNARGSTHQREERCDRTGQDDARPAPGALSTRLGRAQCRVNPLAQRGGSRLQHVPVVQERGNRLLGGPQARAPRAVGHMLVRVRLF